MATVTAPAAEPKVDLKKYLRPDVALMAEAVPLVLAAAKEQGFNPFATSSKINVGKTWSGMHPLLAYRSVNNKPGFLTFQIGSLKNPLVCDNGMSDGVHHSGDASTRPTPQEVLDTPGGKLDTLRSFKIDLSCYPVERAAVEAIDELAPDLIASCLSSDGKKRKYNFLSALKLRDTDDDNVCTFKIKVLLELPEEEYRRHGLRSRVTNFWKPLEWDEKDNVTKRRPLTRDEIDGMQGVPVSIFATASFAELGTAPSSMQAKYVAPDLYLVSGGGSAAVDLAEPTAIASVSDIMNGLSGARVTINTLGGANDVVPSSSSLVVAPPTTAITATSDSGAATAAAAKEERNDNRDLSSKQPAAAAAAAAIAGPSVASDGTPPLVSDADTTAAQRVPSGALSFQLEHDIAIDDEEEIVVRATEAKRAHENVQEGSPVAKIMATAMANGAGPAQLLRDLDDDSDGNASLSSAIAPTLTMPVE
ncbi:MAG: hypothetical protein WC763_05615 [Candidatus Paceibacterota bacterium]|jgi:hypothetical protein